MNDDRFDREIRRFLDREVSQIDGLPTRDEMIERLAPVATGLDRRRRWALPPTPTFRLIVVLAVLAALLVGTLAAGALWNRQHQLVVGPTPTLPAPPIGSIAPGTYLVTAFTATPYTVTVPAGWSQGQDAPGVANGYLSRPDPGGGDGVQFGTWTVSHVYADTCQWRGRFREVDPGAPTGSGDLRPPITIAPAPSGGPKDRLVAAIREQTGHATSAPTEVTLGGLPATRLELSLQGFSLASCHGGIVHLWPDPGLAENGGVPMRRGDIITVYVIEEGGQATALLTIHQDDAPAADLAELQAVLDSLEFRP